MTQHDWWLLTTLPQPFLDSFLSWLTELTEYHRGWSDQVRLQCHRYVCDCLCVFRGRSCSDLLESLAHHLTTLDVANQRQLTMTKYNLLSTKVDPEDKKLISELALQAFNNGMCLTVVHHQLPWLENMEISGNLLILEYSGRNKRIWNILREFLYIRWYFFVTQAETHNKPTCKFVRLQMYLCHHTP